MRKRGLATKYPLKDSGITALIAAIGGIIY